MAIVLLGGCNNEPTDTHPESYVVVEHITDGDRYVLRHNDLEIEAACRNSTFTTNNDRTIHTTNCLTTMPVGAEVQVTRGASNWLYTDWKEAGIDWQMHMNIEREEFKRGTAPEPIRALFSAITIGTFLGVIVALLLLAFIFSKKRQVLLSKKRELLGALREHRKERRVPASVALELSRLDQLSPEERVIYEVHTENASRHGARVIVKKPWQANDRVLISWPQCDRPATARIVYCVPLGEDGFAIGLQFPLMMDWGLLLSDMSSYGLTSHAYRK